MSYAVVTINGASGGMIFEFGFDTYEAAEAHIARIKILDEEWGESFHYEIQESNISPVGKL